MNKHRVPKVSLSMLKGRSAAVSVPSIRFNPGNDDDDDEVEVDQETPCDSSDGITLAKSSVEFEQKAATDHRRILTSSSSADDGTKELSPTKENHPLKFSKRSSSLDSGSYGDGGGKDAWSLFHEIKGKITKTVEETLHIDLRSSDNSSQQSDLDTSKSEERLSPETEMVEEAIDVLGVDRTESSPCSDKKSSLKCCSSAPSMSPVDKIHALSSDLKQRRTRFLSKSETPAMTMSSLMATHPSEDDALLDQLCEEYAIIQEQEQCEKVQESKLVQSTQSKEDEEEEGDVRAEKRQTCVVDDPDSVKRPNSVNGIDRKWLICGVFAVAYCVMPIPSFLVGFVVGCIIAGFVVRFYFQLTSPTIGASFPTVFKSPSTFQLPVISNKTATVHKGWMNQLRQPYNPLEYHVSHTQSVYVRLEGSMLRISHTKLKIPKHASFNEPRHDTSAFFDQRHYDLAGCHVTLLPEGLAKKRLWSRKYPICISLCEGACKSSHISSLGSNLDCEKGSSNNCEEVTVVDSQEKQLYLFTRTCRDKEDWYWRFFKATVAIDDKIKETRSAPSSPKHVTSEDEYSVAAVSYTSSEFGTRLQQTAANSISVPDVTQLVSETESSPISLEPSVLSFFTPEYVLKFENYMQRLLSPKGSALMTNGGETAKKASPVGGEPQRRHSDDFAIDMKWLNSFLSRSFWDFLEDPYWTNLVKNKIQKKLSKIRLPQFIDELHITDLDFGNQLPVVEKISPPEMDERGLWIFLDICYSGIFRMTLETKANLLKLKKDMSVEMSSPDEQRSRSAIFNDEEEDSAESSTDDEGVAEVPDAAAEEGTTLPSATGTSKKLIRIVDKITQSRYFQHATEFKYVRRAVEEVSNTRLILTVEVHSVAGTVALNIPPPPTDRLWYGFKTDPQVTLLAKPKLGERELTMFKLTEWIEKKLIQEFQKVFVFPNMDDIPIPFMSSGLLSQFPGGNVAQERDHSSPLLM